MLWLDPLTTIRRLRPGWSSQFWNSPGKPLSACNQVGHLVHHERSRPPALIGLCRDPREKRAPGRILDIRKAGKPLRDRGSQVATLNLGRGGFRNGVEAVAAPAPFDQQARFADAAAPPDHRERACVGQPSV